MSVQASNILRSTRAAWTVQGSDLSHWKEIGYVWEN